ncbi:MAG: ChuX/HutX family heme-like substrate-binding protein [Candidatus Methylacidiphilales bacterium]
MNPRLILEKKRELETANPKLQPLEIATELGISEGAMVGAQCGYGVIRLNHHALDWMASLPFLGEVIVVTRNRIGLLESRATIQSSIPFNRQIGFKGVHLDCRIEGSGVAESFFVPPSGTVAESIQCFDADGSAIMKLFAVSPHQPHWLPWVEQSAHSDQGPGFSPPVSTGYNEFKQDTQPSAHDEKLSVSWRHLIHPNHLYNFLHRHGIQPLDWMRQLGSDWCARLRKDAVDALMGQSILETHMAITLQSRFARQRFSRQWPPAVSFGQWINLLTADSNLHLNTTSIHQVWRLAVPYSDRLVQHLLLFDKTDQLAISVASWNPENNLPDEAWNKALMDLSPLNIEGQDLD